MHWLTISVFGHLHVVMAFSYICWTVGTLFSDVVVALEANIEGIQQLDDAPKEQSIQQSPGERERVHLAKQGQRKNESNFKQLDDTIKTQSWQQSRGEQERRHPAKQEKGKDEDNGKLANSYDKLIFRL